MTDQSNQETSTSKKDSNDLEIGVTHENPIEFSKNLEVGGTKLLIVDKEKDIISGEAPACCVIGSPEHVAALKAKIKELKVNSENLVKEREEALKRSESVSEQLDTLVKELSHLGQENSDSSSRSDGERTIHATIHTFGRQKLEIIEDDDSINDYDHHKYDRLIRQPKIRQYWYKDTLYREEHERRVSFTELFWDLIFVAVIGNLGHDLVQDISRHNIIKFILTFYPIYKIWMDMTIYMNLYSSDDLLEKFFLLFEMILVITMGTHASGVFRETKSIFLISFVVGRSAFMILNLLHAVWIPLFRSPFISTAWGIFIPSIIWIIAIFVPEDRVTIVMWIAFAFENLWSGILPLCTKFGRLFFRKMYKNEKNVEEDDVDTTDNTNTLVDDPPTSPTSPTSPISPISQNSTNTGLHPHKATKTRGTEYEWKWKELFTSVFRKSDYRPALNIEHYSERLGLFAIITLGESVLGALYNTLNPVPDGQLAKAILGLLIAFNLHWIYFDVDASRQFQHALRRSVVTGILFGTVHFPMNMALIAFGASLGTIVQIFDFSGAHNTPMKRAVESNESSDPNATSDSHGSLAELPSSLSWLFCVTLAISLYCMATIGMLHKGLDEVESLRVPKNHRILLRFIIGTICLLLPLSKVNSLNLVVITSMLTLFLVIFETFGRMRKGVPLFGRCEEDVILHPNYKKFVRWRWGNKNLNRSTWSTGILRSRNMREREPTMIEKDMINLENNMSLNN